MSDKTEIKVESCRFLYVDGELKAIIKRNPEKHCTQVGLVEWCNEEELAELFAKQAISGIPNKNTK